MSLRAAGPGGHDGLVTLSAGHALVVSRSDLVVLAVLMPGLDGLAVCRRIRQLGFGTPVLLLTARDVVSDRVMGLDVLGHRRPPALSGQIAEIRRAAAVS